MPGTDENHMAVTAERAGTIDPAEVDRFAALAATWWDESGPFRALHRVNPTRLAFLRERAALHFARDARALRPLEGLSALDIGCGGGLVSEPLARLGAAVVGLDAVAENVRLGQAHADAQGLAIAYRVGATEDIAEAGKTFDLVVAFEVIEHVADRDRFLDACARLVKPGGLIVLGTLARTLRALLLAVIGAEYILGWIPRGTHDWRRFVDADELERVLRARGFAPDTAAGLTYDPARDVWSLSRDTRVNYLLSATRPHARS